MSIFNSGIKIAADMSVNDQLVAANLDWQVIVSPAVYKTVDGFYKSDSTNIAYRSDNF